MHINQPDALKNWLTSVLEPLCDADPSALARYVLALLKKDKAIKELAQCMTDQLDVFLGAETANFLNQLFEVIKSEDYLNAASVTAVKQDNAIETKTINSQMDEQTSNNLSDVRECTPPIVDVKMKEINSIHVVNNNIANSIEEVSPILQLEKTPNDAISSISSQDFSPVKQAPSITMERDKHRRRSSLQSKSRSRSRSHSYEKQQNRSRSRDRRIADREKSSRQYRNQSPPHQFGVGSGGGGGGGIGSGSVGIGNDRRKFDRRIGDRSPTMINSYGRQRIDRSKSRSISPLMSRQRKNSMSPLNSADLSSKLKRQRCRDFDEKGYCMRGETCPWDHGTDPVVLEDIHNPSMLIQNAPHMRGGGGSAAGAGGGEYNPDAPELWNRGNNFGPRGPMHRNGPPPPPPPPPPNAYQRLGIGFRGMPPYPFPMNPAVTPLQRELISIPVADGSSGGDISAVQIKRRYEPEDTVAIAEGPTKRKPINSRLGPRIGLQQNCSLELRKVPRGLNSIAHLNNHFSKFGKIINIQISYDGDPEAAIVTFSTHAEANVAYRSTEAVLNNRFIKVFWHTPGGNGNNNGGTNDTQIPSSKDEIISHVKKGNQYSLNNITNNANTLLNNNNNNNINNANNMIPAVPTAAATTDVPKPVPPVTATTTTTSTPIHSTGATVNSTTVSNSTSTLSTSTALTTSTSAITTNAISAAAAALRTKIRVNRAATEIIRKKQEDRVKGTVQLVNMNKKKHEILQEYLKQMRSCVDYLERADANDPKRGQYVATINDLQLLIDKLNKDIAAEQAQITAHIPAQPPPARTKEQAKKEILDLELELIAQQQEGNDTTTIEKRLEELQKSLPSTISTKSNFGARVVRPRPPPPGSTSVDRRPSSLIITGFSTEETDAILGHFKHFGEVTNSQFDKSIPYLLITYATRTIAEQAALRGQFFKEKTLKIKWALPNSTTVKKAILETVNGSTATGGVGIGTGGGVVGGDVNMSADSEEIRMEEEEEEEDTESESRSWRR